MSRRIRWAGVFVGLAGIALGIAAAVAALGGSPNFAWFMVATASGFFVVAIAEALGLESWVKSSPGRRRLYLAASSAILAVAVGLYLLWDTVALWWLAPVATVPFYLLLLWEPAQRRDGGANDVGGPLTPP